MKRSLLLLIAITLSANSFGQTNVSGIISSNTTWNLENSPYHVMNNILVTDGATLTIEPGVVVDFQGPYYLEVNGTLNAIGTENDSIYFQGQSWGSNFKGINLNGVGSRISHSVIKNATQDEAMIWVNGATIQNSRITNISREVWAVNGSKITNCMIHDMRYIALSLGQSSIAEGNEIFNVNGDRAVEVATGSIFRHNRVYQLNGVLGILAQEGTIEYNTIGGSTGYHGHNGVAIVEDSVILRYNNIGGFDINIGINGSTPVINNNNFIGTLNTNSDELNVLISNEMGFFGYGTINSYSGQTTINFENNYWGNISSELLDESIYDFSDDFSVLGIVDYTPKLASPDTNAPISAPKLISKTAVNNDVEVNWEPNLEEDLAGYKVHFGDFTGKNFSNSVDVGNVNTYTIQNMDPESLILVTAYDNESDGIDDLIEGHESWYSNDLDPVAEILNGDTYVCQGEIIILQANKNETYAYQWLIDGAVIEDATKDSLEVWDEGNYQVIETNLNGIKDTSLITTVIVAELAVNLDSEVIMTCGDSYNLNAEVYYTGSEELSYNWLPETGLSDPNSPNTSVRCTSSTNYILSVTNNHGCSVENSVYVTVEPLTVSINNTQIPCGSSTELSIETNYSGPDELVYKWMPADGLSADNIQNPQVTLLEETTYSVEITTSNGCVASNETTLSITATDYEPTICAVSVNENDYNVIVWEKTEDKNLGSFNIYRESSMQADSYDFIGEVAYFEMSVFIDSSSDASVQSNKYKISANDACGLTTNMSPEHKTMHLTVNKGFGNTWNLIWEAYEGVAVSNYKIYRGSTATNLTEIGVVSGSNTTYTDENVTGNHAYYMIEITLPNSCVNIESTESLKSSSTTDYSVSRSNIISTESSTGISSNTAKSVVIYPNPAKDHIFINTEDYTKMNGYQLKIINLIGAVVFETNMEEPLYEVNLSPQYSKGLYFVQVFDSGGSIIDIQKLILQ